MSPVDINWIVEVRNYEIPKAFKSAIQRSPREFAWDEEWYVVDVKSTQEKDVTHLMTHNMTYWSPMVPTTMEDCLTLMALLSQQFNERNKYSSTVEWRIRNTITGEVIPGIIVGA